MSFISAHNSRYRLQLCDICEDRVANTVEHLLGSCSYFTGWRHSLREKLVRNCDNQNEHLIGSDSWLTSIISGGCCMQEACIIVDSVHTLIDSVREILTSGLPK